MKRKLTPRIEQMYANGMSDAEIACALDCPICTVTKWRTRHGKPRNIKIRKTPRQYNSRFAPFKPQMLEMYGQGLNDRIIAETIGCSVQTVAYWRRVNGLPAQRKYVRKQNKAHTEIYAGMLAKALASEVEP